MLISGLTKRKEKRISFDDRVYSISNKRTYKDLKVIHTKYFYCLKRTYKMLKYRQQYEKIVKRCPERVNCNTEPQNVRYVQQN